MAYIGTSPSQGVRHRYLFTATSGQTTFSGADDDSRTLSYTDTKFMDVFLNGVLLDPNSDYTATTGTSVVLTSGASAGDLLEVIAFDSFSVFSGTFGGDVTVGGTLDATTATFDRASTDGTIIDLQKDGTTVGSIKSHNGAFLQVESAGDKAGLLFGSSAYYPVKNGSVNNGGVDIGEPSYNFRNLYLSGGAYIGGTGAANYLDDYEEGTWTPTIENGTLTATNPRYVKIGKQVTVWALLLDFSDRTSAAAVNIGGLPFTTDSLNLATSGTMHRYINAGGASVQAYTFQSTNTLTFYACSQNTSYTNVLHSQLSSTSSVIFVTISYRAA